MSQETSFISDREWIFVAFNLRCKKRIVKLCNRPKEFIDSSIFYGISSSTFLSFFILFYWWRGRHKSWTLGNKLERVSKLQSGRLNRISSNSCSRLFVFSFFLAFASNPRLSPELFTCVNYNVWSDRRSAALDSTLSLSFRISSQKDQSHTLILLLSSSFFSLLIFFIFFLLIFFLFASLLIL